MYTDFINNRIIVYVSSRGESFLEYEGILESENEEQLILKDASIKFAIANFQKGMFGNGISSLGEGIEKIIINKKYIISCYK